MVTTPPHYKLLFLFIQTFALLLCCSLAYAGDYSWTAARVSPAINYMNHDVTAVYSPAVTRFVPGSKITRVYASRSYGGNAIVQTSLCWNGVTNCIPLTGSSIHTHAFDGLDPARPLYLVHNVSGNGPLPSPLFVKGNVVVWFAP